MDIIMKTKPRYLNICIPRVDVNISRSQILKIFCQLKVGYIEHLNDLPIKGVSQYKRVVMRIKCNDSDRAKFILNRFDEGKNIKIVYSMPLYWICVPNRQFEYQKPYYLLDALEPPDTIPE
jgi:hypothetical protein